jgi:hypothetical protein
MKQHVDKETENIGPFEHRLRQGEGKKTQQMGSITVEAALISKKMN